MISSCSSCPKSHRQVRLREAYKVTSVPEIVDVSVIGQSEVMVSVICEE
jgi:hypothetical protein